MLTLFRRHTTKCPHKHKGRSHGKCDCPVHVDGYIRGERVNKRTLKTRNWDIAKRLARDLEEELLTGRTRKRIDDAFDQFFAELGDVEDSTVKRYVRAIAPFQKFVTEQGARWVDEITVALIGRYRVWRGVAETTWQTELQILRYFAHFAFERKWLSERPFHAKTLRAKRPRPRRERLPYTTDEIIAIYRAAQAHSPRAYALVLLMRRYGLRISDAALLRRESVQGDRIVLNQKKTGKLLVLPLYAEVRAALEAVPMPRGAQSDCPYFFVTGIGSEKGSITAMSELVGSIFRKSRVPDAHAHRFRHTAVNDLLMKGWTFERIAVLLGDDAKTLQRHYAHMTLSRIEDMHHGLQASMGATWERENFAVLSPVDSELGVVPAVGLEPTTCGL